MTAKNPAPGIDPGLPTASTLVHDSQILLGLIEALNSLAHKIGPQGNGLFAIINCALPRMEALASDIDQFCSSRKGGA